VLQRISDSAWRERIGNAVPSAAAEAIAESWPGASWPETGETFSLESEPVWVSRSPIAITV